VLLSKSAIAGAQSMLLFLMARTPGAPVTKEIKPAAAIAWKKIGYGPISRGGRRLRLVDARPRPLGETFSTPDPTAGRETDVFYEDVFIDTGENGVFSAEEFALISSGGQMEFVTPEEIASYLVFEIEGRQTGRDIISALDSSVLGPTYRAGILRHWAIERMNELQEQHGVHSVAFEMLGPPRNSKLLFEAHLLRRCFSTMDRVRAASAPEISARVLREVEGDAALRREIVSIGIPILLPDGRVLRGPECKIPPATAAPAAREVTPDHIEVWAAAGWVDLREANMARWKDRFDRIRAETDGIPAADSSSRFLRDRQFWGEQGTIQPGKVVGWVFATEEQGARMK